MPVAGKSSLPVIRSFGVTARCGTCGLPKTGNYMSSTVFLLLDIQSIFSVLIFETEKKNIWNGEILLREMTGP